MFSVTSGNQKNFEIGIYNQEVRECVKENNRHLDFGDEWADVHYQSVVAETKDEALGVIKNRYPAQKGFVIASCAEARYDCKF
ncbi:conserved hypothetical protein [Candidatus Terasakiella magnetica]|uniref:Uncharacterized protein n=1 Tax=Candidatus Terasakiella magnetica TaxID=1867952 RepID=A0A1C3RD74_9PROT|nr:hypothetical protein [Candidatus Terasakiella magnetica]SCA55226.1 conserved hypothetical protein [Candidatus Terasakiella magnetica]